ncbi:MAG: cobyric acid synthase, partial [Vallitaleaceae bacterium]|nr:cobyric acid synthase [Vallitaleaceae bacterium]
ELKPVIMEAYEVLNSQFDVIVMEGAGSPAEINLRENDIVNMGMAQMVDAPVILVGDIDKGGVFAALYGTIMLLEPEEQARIKGYIINKFRGDVDILKPGLDLFYQKIPIPCLGVIPFMPLSIDDEDSVTTRFAQKKQADLKIGILRLPYMSNFTDFTVFDMENDVSVVYIQEESLEDLDLIVLPGSKNTLKDMAYLHNSGLSQKIYRAHRSGTPIMGICGGYQMLGLTISDPHGVETSESTINGLGLLNAHTTMSLEKTTVQMRGRLEVPIQFVENLEEMNLVGYEIHMGVTELHEGTKAAILLEDGRWDGGINEAGDVFGSYLHGIFDNNAFRNALLNTLRLKKGLLAQNTMDYESFKEKEYDRLADLVRSHVDLEKIKEIVGID